MKDLLNRINYPAVLKKSILYIAATALCELGIACYYTARLGTDPISVFVEGISFHVDLTVGQISTICNIVLGILCIIFERRQFGLGTFITILIAGPMIDLFYGMLLQYFPPETTAVAIRVLIIAAGIIFYAIGLGLAIICDLGVGPFSFPPIFLARVLKADLKYTQIATDAMYFIIGMLLGGVIGAGSVISVLFTGPLMTMFMKMFEPVMNRIGPIVREDQDHEYH